MKHKIVITIILFIFSFLLIKSGVYFIRENDALMKTLKEKQSIYNLKPIDAIITENTMIPGINGRQVNLKKSYNNMKGINEFKESLLVFDEIKPDKTIDNIYDKVIVSGNLNIKQVTILTKLDDKYCHTEDLTIKKECIQNSKYTILIHKITNNYLSNIKENLSNGKIFYLQRINQDEYDLILKYIKTNNYIVIPINKLIAE